MADDTLPTGQELAARLYEQGLAPPGCEEIAVYGTPRYWYRVNGAMWQPWHRIDHAWHLVGQFTLSIDYHPAISMSGGHVCPARWWIGQAGKHGAIVYTFREVPQAICHAALWAAGRAEK